MPEPIWLDWLFVRPLASGPLPLGAFLNAVFAARGCAGPFRAVTPLAPGRRMHAEFDFEVIHTDGDMSGALEVQ